ncbi:hypothetical protein A2415_00880 [candidate division WWE3 bacterium RIFOXYC1_FULL_39_7]|uniref:Uncharacterized protein n=2 Tax=Katanobacteria TaxID=422282 RepID=A0A1F4X6Z3_UNCKA|nr:MAG: hypothetical protein A2415_00880 [candidate division WWE3 bacterium RIFOXYC1_FULL_39_7]OGC77454.1 MAG: hypothetical protein A2619_03850 [candidate division WWE3 bacterium RIFOXYD1_FULL_39_9]
MSSPPNKSKKEKAMIVFLRAIDVPELELAKVRTWSAYFIAPLKRKLNSRKVLGRDTGILKCLKWHRAVFGFL